VIFSPGKLAMAFAPLSTLIPGTIPCCSSTSTKLRPSRVFCRIVSSNKITPLMNSPTSFVVNKISTIHPPVLLIRSHIDAFQSLLDRPRTFVSCQDPFPGATSFLATDSKVSVFMRLLLIDVFLLLSIIASNKFVASLKMLAVRLIKGSLSVCRGRRYRPGEAVSFPYSQETHALRRHVGDVQCAAFLTGNWQSRHVGESGAFSGLIGAGTGTVGSMMPMRLFTHSTWYAHAGAALLSVCMTSC
jgi:hypothetical protein